jgi:8-oxo-dGTP pyrophosphatase MutT (NUDIX family)
MIEVMLISGRSDRVVTQALQSHKKKKASRWIYPKGGWDDDETVGEAALREAREEAGVRGHLLHDHGGDEGQSPLLLHTVRYTVNPAKLAKKHTETSVSIYVLRVESIESSETWAEGQSRSRCWFPLSTARALLAAQTESGSYIDKYETVETMDKIATWANSAPAAAVEWLGGCDAKALDLDEREQERYAADARSSDGACRFPAAAVLRHTRVKGNNLWTEVELAAESFAAIGMYLFLSLDRMTIYYTIFNANNKL